MSELAEANISVVNDVFIKQITFRESGQVMKSHVHCYDHQTLLASGRIAMHVDGETTIRDAPAILVVKAGLTHEFMGLLPNTILYCIHAIKGGEMIDEAEPLVVGMANVNVGTVEEG